MMTIIVLWILLGLIALIVILLHFSARIYVHAAADGLTLKIKYFWFTVYPREPKSKKRQKLRKSLKPLRLRTISATILTAR